METQPKRAPMPADLMVEAKCRSCGNTIHASADRIAVVLLELSEPIDYDEGSSYRQNGTLRSSPTALACELETESGGVCFYCEECAGKVPQFTADNPWLPARRAVMPGPPSLWKSEWVAEDRRQWEQEQQAQNAATEARLRKSVPAGDMRAFDAALPTSPESEDVMAHAASLDSLAASAGCSLDQFIGSHADTSPAREESSGSVEAMRKGKLRRFLDSTQSRGRLRPNMREAAKLWVGGESQAEIARRLRVEQSTVSRMINGAMKMADSQG